MSTNPPNPNPIATAGFTAQLYQVLQQIRDRLPIRKSNYYSLRFTLAAGGQQFIENEIVPRFWGYYVDPVASAPGGQLAVHQGESPSLQPRLLLYPGMYAREPAREQRVLVTNPGTGSVTFVFYALGDDTLEIIPGSVTPTTTAPVFVNQGYAGKDTLSSQIGSATAPAANAAIATIAAPGAGTYEIYLLLFFSAGTAVLADSTNWQLRHGATVFSTFYAPTGNFPAIEVAETRVPRMTIAAGEAITINAAAAGTAGVTYNALILATQVP